MAALSVVAHLMHAVLATVSPLVLAVALGALVANAKHLPAPVEKAVSVASRRLLRLGVVLLGLRLSVLEVMELGPSALAVVAITVAITFFGTQWVGRKMGLGADQSLLVATGFSICGASAIAAVESAIEGRREDVAVAIGLVTVCGTLAVGVLPAVAPLLGLQGPSFGAWAGASVHDVGQVIATASTAGPAALSTAVVVKLTRVALLAPLVAGVDMRRRRRSSEPGTRRVAPLPVFLLGFLAMVAVRSTGVLGDGLIDAGAQLEQAFLTAALVGLGMGVILRDLRQVGRRPVLLGLVSWLMVATVSYLGVSVTTWA